MQAWIYGIAAYVINLELILDLASSISIPFFKSLLLDLKWFYIPFAIFVVVGVSNTVNLADGLDRIAVGPVIITSACFALKSYFVQCQLITLCGRRPQFDSFMP